LFVLFSKIHGDGNSEKCPCYKTGVKCVQHFYILNKINTVLSAFLSSSGNKFHTNKKNTFITVLKGDMSYTTGNIYRNKLIRHDNIIKYGGTF
jgi:hypothetical protein